MNENKFLKEYFSNFSKLIFSDDKLLRKIILLSDKIIKLKKANKKILIFGNGGSAAIASHFSVDLSKNCKIRCTNYNESDLITCFANDYGYEHWVGKAIEFYADKGDMLIAISSSGMSKNMINACKVAKKMKLSSIITFSGFNINNKLSRLGNINFWANSNSYNYVENLHQLWLLASVDLIISKKKY